MDDKKEQKNTQLFPVTTTKWNSVIEKNIKEIGESCKGYKWMHITSARSAMQSYNLLMYVTMIIGPLGGLFGAISSSEEWCNNTSTFQILIVVSGFVSGVFASIIKYSKYNERSVDHKTAAAKYTSLEGNIRRQLSLYRDDRVNAGKYLQWVSVSFDDLFSASPLVTRSVYNEWVKFANAHDLFVPKELGSMVDTESDNIKNLADVGDIQVNNGESSADLTRSRAFTAPHVNNSTVVDIDPDKQRRGDEDDKKTLSKDKTKRTCRYTAYPELHRFADPRMEYEFTRMFGQ